MPLLQILLKLMNFLNGGRTKNGKVSHQIDDRTYCEDWPAKLLKLTALVKF